MDVPNVPSSLLSAQTVLIIICAVVVLAITTRLQTGSIKSHTVRDGSVYDVQPVPYWLPIIGHIPEMAFDATSFLRRLRDRYTDGAYLLNLGGTRHNIIYTPSLVTALLNAKEALASHKTVAESIGENVFGFPMKTESEAYHKSSDEIRECYHHLMNEEDLKIMVTRTANVTNRIISNLVSYSTSLVDQAYWERTAQCELITNSANEQVVAANFVDLIRDFCAAASNEAVIGSDFPRNFPNYLADLWAVDRAFIYLGAGLPRWTPIPLVTRAHIARRSLIRSLAEFETALDKHIAGEDPGPTWGGIDDVGALLKERVRVYRKYGLSMEARAAFTFGLIWATNANSNMLVFWMLTRIYADKEILARVRAEIAPYVAATQPKKILPVAEPPRLSTLDVDGLCNDCPLLKSCYVECLRIDSGTWSFKTVKEDFILSGRDKQSKAFLMRKGDFIHAAHDVHNSNPAYFPEPETWIADRHVRVDEKGKQTADLGTIRPYGGGSSMCKGRFFAYKECMIFVAAVLAMWDIEPANGKAWKIPGHRKATGVYGSTDATRVHVRRRELPEEQ